MDEDSGEEGTEIADLHRGNEGVLLLELTYPEQYLRKGIRRLFVSTE
jgi:hypothetical protein